MDELLLAEHYNLVMKEYNFVFVCNLGQLLNIEPQIAYNC